MLERLHRQQFRVLKRTESLPDAGGSTRTTWVPQEPLYGVVTRVNTDDEETFHSNILNRQKRIRTFSEVSVTYRDKILLDGEEWEIIGEPESVSSSMNTRKKTTLIIIGKEGS